MIETKRLFIRALEPKDATDLFSYRSDKESNKYQGWIPETLEETLAFIQKNPPEINIPETWFQLGIVEKESGKLIGDIGLHFLDKENKQLEIGCTIDKHYQNQKFALEALEAIIQYFFTQKRKQKITASIDPRNTASIRLMEHLGFLKEAYFEKSIFLRGEWLDDVIYNILAEDWEAEKQ